MDMLVYIYMLLSSGQGNSYVISKVVFPNKKLDFIKKCINHLLARS